MNRVKILHRSEAPDLMGAIRYAVAQARGSECNLVN
jgi:hypothetical protein